MKRVKVGGQPDLKEERADHAAGVLIDRLTKQPCILAVGGEGHGNIAKASVEVYWPGSDQWNQGNLTHLL